MRRGTGSMDADQLSCDFTKDRRVLQLKSTANPHSFVSYRSSYARLKSFPNFLFVAINRRAIDMSVPCLNGCFHSFADLSLLAFPSAQSKRRNRSSVVQLKSLKSLHLLLKGKNKTLCLQKTIFEKLTKAMRTAAENFAR